ncbi:MAG: VOC family protein [Anaerolineales bacterium]|jgi:predicted enzyme related to lactoylglutathione lyase
MKKNPVVFWELASHDAEASVRFLRDVFEWDVSFDEGLGFYIVPDSEPGRKIDGGVFTLKKAKLPFLTIYIEVDDLEAMVKSIEEHGGHIVEPPLDLPSGSRICLFNEPSGVTLAIIQSSASK